MLLRHQHAQLGFIFLFAILDLAIQSLADLWIRQAF
jgi:hypothetical protein